MTTSDYSLGCRMPIDEWVHLNRFGVFQDPALRRYVSPFPPRELMQNVSGLVVEQDFASHGADFYVALSAASPKPLSAFRSVLDFGCGCGRLARMFKGHPGLVAGCDIDRRHIEWMDGALDFVSARLSSVSPPIPYDDGAFEAIISISIFTHLNEKSQDEFLRELARVSAEDGLLFLTVHGARALQRAVEEPLIRSMIAVPDAPFDRAKADFAADRHAFILQDGHLTTTLPQGNKPRLVEEPFEYGITFVSESYVRERWTRWFDVVDYRSGALHDFQDLVVLRPARSAS